MKRPRPTIALLTDFGQEDSYVGAMKGVILAGNPEATIVDISHDVAPQGIGQAAYLLWSCHHFFPRKTIFVCVVDPGVGSDRRIIGVRAGQFSFLAPDNGLLDFVLAEADVREAVQLFPFLLNGKQPKKLVPREISTTFHGRDIFAPIAAMMSTGTDLPSLGVPVTLRRPDSPFASLKSASPSARILHIDRFGNIVTNIKSDAASRAMRYGTAIQIGRKQIRTWIEYYDQAPPQTPCLILGSNHLVEISVKDGSAADLLSINLDTKIRVVRK